jgi:hypothetical protein
MIRSIKHTEATLDQKYVFGFVNGEFVEAILVRADLDPADQVIYDDYNSLFTDNCFGNILNTPNELDMDCFQPDAVIEGTDDLDYATMSAGDKAKVDALALMVERLYEAPTE